MLRRQMLTRGLIGALGIVLSPAAVLRAGTARATEEPNDPQQQATFQIHSGDRNAVVTVDRFDRYKGLDGFWFTPPDSKLEVFQPLWDETGRKTLNFDPKTNRYFVR